MFVFFKIGGDVDFYECVVCFDYFVYIMVGGGIGCDWCVDGNVVIFGDF